MLSLRRFLVAHYVKCPMEVNLEESTEPWRCEISLRYEYTFDPTGKVILGTSKRKRVGPWHKKEVPETAPFVVLSSKDGLTDCLFGAQQAFLNPSSDPNGFLLSSSRSMSAFQLPQVAHDQQVHQMQVPFSPNVVVVTIRGPNLPTLSFFDLPGVISQHSEDYVVKMIQGLVLEYIKDEKCLIIQTLTMDHDAANSAAAGLIKRAKATERTIGVLTKPDRLYGDAIAQYRSILSNERFPLGRGYYCVLNNVDDDIDRPKARQLESDFFRDNVHFAQDLAEYADRFGIPKLQQVASDILFQNSVDSLPVIHSKIHGKSVELQRELERLPKPPEGNVSWEIQSKIVDFSKNVLEQINGGSLQYRFFATWHDRAKEFRQKLVFSHPLLLMPQVVSGFDGRESSEISSSPRSTPSGNQRSVETIDLEVDEGEHHGGQKRRKAGASIPIRTKPEISPEKKAARGKIFSYHFL